MMLQLALLPALACLAYAESTVTSMYIYGADMQPLAASIVGNDATATTYSINCPPGTDSSDCGMGPGMTVIAGPGHTSTYVMEEGSAFYMTATCSVGKSAVCTDTMGGPEANFPGSHTTTDSVALIPVTVTGGSTTSSGSSTSGSGSGATVAETSATSTPTTPTTPGTVSGTAASTGGVSQITGGLGGASVVLMFITRLLVL